MNGMLCNSIKLLDSLVISTKNRCEKASGMSCLKKELFGPKKLFQTAVYQTPVQLFDPVKTAKISPKSSFSSKKLSYQTPPMIYKQVDLEAPYSTTNPRESFP